MPRIFNWIPVCTGMTIVIFLFVYFFSNNTLAATSADYYQINQTVCDRFEGDTARLAAIMEEVRRRKGIKETRVAYGHVNTPIEQADYWVTYGAEAIAYQRSKKYSSAASLKSDLGVLQGKILKAKAEVKKVINEK